MTESAPEKLCVLCGRSCAGQPRMRDDRGRYAHVACIESRRQASPPRSGAPNKPAPDPAPIALDDTPPRPAPALRTACPGCGIAARPGVVECEHCGTHILTGKAPRAPRSARARRDPGAPRTAPELTSAHLALSAALAGAGAIAAGLIWIAASAATGESYRYLAFLVGALAGVGALIPVRGAGSTVTGASAGLASLLVVGAALGLTPADDTGPFVYEDFQVIDQLEVAGLGESQAFFFTSAWIGLGALTGLSLGLTNTYDDPDDEDEA